MKVVHLGGNAMGERVLATLRTVAEDTVETVTTMDDLVAVVDAWGGADWFVSAGFRHLVPDGLLGRAADTLNVHPSLLPWGRGAHPNVWAIVAGEPAGVTLHRMVAAVDAGDIWAQDPVEVRFDDLGPDLYRRLEDAAVALFDRTWADIRSHRLTPTPQPAGGSVHRVRDLRSLVPDDLDAPTTWRAALAVLRALTFPPHENFVVVEDGTRYHVELSVRALPGESDGD